MWKRSQRECLREDGRRARRKRRTMEKPPDAAQPCRGGVRPQFPGDRGIGPGVQERTVVKRAGNVGRRRRSARPLRLVKLVLKGRAAVLRAFVVLMRLPLIVIAAREKIQGGNLLQLAMIARHRPGERDEENQCCFGEPHGLWMQCTLKMFNQPSRRSANTPRLPTLSAVGTAPSENPTPQIQAGLLPGTLSQTGKAPTRHRPEP